MNRKKLKEIIYFFLEIPFLKSFLASIRAGRFIFVFRDKDNDLIYRWNFGAAVTCNPLYSPKNDLIDLKCFLYNYNPKQSDIVLIVGVADGYEVPFFCNNTKTVICIEPTPNCIRRLNKLKKILSLKNLIIIQSAVGKEISKLNLLVNKNNEINNRISYKENESDTITVEVKTLTRILKDIDILNIDYCKINIEGEEKNALLGLDLDQVNIRKFCISSHDFMGPSTRTYDWINNWLLQNKYSVMQYPESLENFYMNYYLFGELKSYKE